MPTISRKNGTSVGVNTEARKFSKQQGVEQQSSANKNSSFDSSVVDSNASLASVAETVARLAREDLSVIRARLSQTTSDENVLNKKTSVMDFDVSVSLELMSKTVAESTSGSIEFSRELFKRVPSSVVSKRESTEDTPVFNPVVPTLDSVSVDLDPSRGSIDCFFSSVRFSLPKKAVDTKNIVAVRVFRATTLSPKYSRGFLPQVSMRGLEILSSQGKRTRVKVDNSLESMVRVFSESGVDNAIAALNPRDPFTGLRISADASVSSFSSEKNSASTSRNESETGISSFVDSSLLVGIDKSVATDPKSLENIRKAQGSSVSVTRDEEFSVRVAKVNEDKGMSGKIVSENNFGEFREIAFLSLDKLRATTIGSVNEYSLLDESVGYGKGYRYFIVSVSKDMVESVRSQIVEIVVEGVRVPERPKRVFLSQTQTSITVNSLVEDLLVEKFEIYRKYDNATSVKKFSRDIVSKGFNVGVSIQNPLDSGYIKIGESLNSRVGGGMFIDRDVTPGKTYSYRIFSVDVFGNKSESPEESSIFCPERSVKNNELVKPSMTAEVDSATGKMRVTFKCSDERVTRLFLSRKDLTINQHAFTTPSQVNRIVLGNAKVGQGNLMFEDIVLRGDTKDTAWTGMFENSLDETIFVDRTVSLDHVYQYKIYGVDKFGNSTSNEITKPVMVTRRPMVDSPVNLSAKVVQGKGFTVGGVSLEWQESNIDIASEDLLGSQNSLSNTSIRTLYQLERKKIGEEIWREFPLTEEKKFFDPSEQYIGAQTPGFRPDPIVQGETYVYRVKCMQTGSFVSNYSSQISVFASLPIVEPQNFKLRVSDARVKPFYVALNWDTSNSSGPIDKWQIERSQLNNFAAAKINSKNPDDIARLSFKKFRDIFKESSRFSSQQVDTKSKSDMFTGQHFFQDSNVKVGNTYYYRIRSVGIDGTTSSWVYKGIKITDAVFERRVSVMLSNDDVRELTNSISTVSLEAGRETRSMTKTSLSLQPNFSNPYVVSEPIVSTVEKKKLTPIQVASYDTSQGGKKTI